MDDVKLGQLSTHWAANASMSEWGRRFRGTQFEPQFSGLEIQHHPVAGFEHDPLGKCVFCPTSLDKFSDIRCAAMLAHYRLATENKHIVPPTYNIIHELHQSHPFTTGLDHIYHISNRSDNILLSWGACSWNDSNI